MASQVLVTRREAAEILASSISTIVRLENAGALPAVRLRGGMGRVRYALSDVERLIEAARKPVERVRIPNRERRS